MKSEYFKNLIHLKEPTRRAYESHLERIQRAFQQLQQNHDNHHCYLLERELSALKDLRELKPKDKQPIYKYFLQRNLVDFGFMRDQRGIELRIMKMVKTPLEGYKLNWLDVWKRLLEKEPELSTTRLYGELADFLKNIRHLYGGENPVEVVDYFAGRHAGETDQLHYYITLFAHLTHQTPGGLIEEYLRRLLRMYDLNQLKARNLLVMFINASKYRQATVPVDIYHSLNQIIIYSLSMPQGENKESIENKFNTQTTNIVVKILGKKNPESVHILQVILQLVKHYIRPFEDSKKPLKFLGNLIAGLAKRIEGEQEAQKRLEKLKEKESKQRKESQDGGEETKPEAPKAEGKKEEKKEGDQEEESEDEESEGGESDEEEQQVDKNNGIEIEIEENAADKPTSLASKIERLEASLQNPVTPQILEKIKQFLEEQFENIFYVNSKKIVSRLFREAFKIYPQLVPRAFDALQKAANIPQINEDGLISNIRQMAKYLFSPQISSEPGFLDSILRVVEKIGQTRRISDVWQIFNIFVQKIPLLDEKDTDKVDDGVKEDFLTRFGQQHDRFYEGYSEGVFEALKRLFEECQHMDQGSFHTVDKHLFELMSNCHPQFKKRVVKEMEENIIQNNNRFLLLLYQHNVKPSPIFEEELKGLIDNRNMDSEDNLELDINVNMILSANMDIGQVKQLIRKYAKRSNYRFLKQVMLNLTNYALHMEPLPSSLAHLTTKPVFKLTQEPPFPLIQQKLAHVHAYVGELVKQLWAELEEFDSFEVRGLEEKELLERLYKTGGVDFKNMKVEKRKVVNELLEMINIIVENLFHEVEEYSPEKKSILTREAPYKRESLLKDPTFLEVVDRLCWHELFLHDNNIMHSLSSILDNEVFFMYRQQMRVEREMIKKFTRKQQKEEMPNETSYYNASNSQLTKHRMAHLSLLLNQHRDEVAVQGLMPQLKTLLLAPGNDKNNPIHKIILKKSSDLAGHADGLIRLLGLNINSRFYYEKVFSFIYELQGTKYTYSNNQVVSLIGHHVPLLQSETLKIREHSLKSFERVVKVLSGGRLFGEVEQQLRGYARKEKQELIWIISLIIILKEPRRDIPLDQYLDNLLQYLRELTPLLTSPTRIVRRLSLFAYSYCLRKAKKATVSYEEVSADQVEYSETRSIQQLYQHGFLRPEHTDRPEGVANLPSLRKNNPYHTHLKKVKHPHPTYAQIEEEAYSFIWKEEGRGMELLKQFHTDMAGSVEQLISMVHNKKNDLSEVTLRLLDGSFIYIKLKKLAFDRFELFFGERFFRGIMQADMKSHQLSFFSGTHKMVDELISSNLQTYDNQTIIFTYLYGVLFALNKHHSTLDPELKKKAHQFIISVTEQILYRGSAGVFKKLLLVLAKVENKKSLQFLIDYCVELKERREKVARVSQMLFELWEDDFDTCTQLLEWILKERLELQNSYVQLLSASLITLPEKYLISEEANHKYRVIDVEKERQAGKIQTYMETVHMPSIERYTRILLARLEEFIVEGQGQQGNELTKAAFTLLTHSLTCFIQFYETEPTIRALLALLELVFKLLEYKMELVVDFKLLEDALKAIFGNKFDQIEHFEAVLSVVVENLHKVPLKKQADLVKIIANRPGNFLFIRRDLYMRFIAVAARLEENSMIYKENMLSLATLMAYAPIQRKELDELVKPLTKGQSLLAIQSYALSTVSTGGELVARILRESGKDRRNTFCKELLGLRGKKEYLDDQEQLMEWKEIKQYSNPYHYHA